MTQPPAEILGANLLGTARTHFCVWAPHCRQVDVHLVYPEDRLLPLTAGRHSYFTGTFSGVPAESLYFYRLDGQTDRPDPASRAQPRGVHGPSQVIDPSFSWHDDGWTGLALPDYILYELHRKAPLRPPSPSWTT
jgi:maltooligosyltrehalose trehalohydrolase